MHDVVSKRLFQKVVLALCVSAVFNISLTFFCIFFWKQSGRIIAQKSIYQPLAPQESAPLTLAAAISSMEGFSEDELCHCLEDETVVSDGYRIRDIALSVLIRDYYFDIARALGSSVEQLEQRPFQEITLYPGLDSEAFTKVRRFAFEERWPYTAEGLFVRLQKQSDDEALQAAFLRTDEYLLVETLLTRPLEGAYPMTQRNVLDIIFTGPWKVVADLSREEKLAGDFSRNKRFQYITSYLAHGSKPAAHFLATHEQELTLSQVDDDTLLRLIGLLDEGRERDDFVALVLKTPRSERVLRVCREIVRGSPIATAKVSETTKTSDIKPSDVKRGVVATEEKLVGKKAITGVSRSAAANKKGAKAVTYVVQSGDSLWKIARKYHISIARLKEENRLTSDALKPGYVLKIPSENQK